MCGVLCGLLQFFEYILLKVKIALPPKSEIFLARILVKNLVGTFMISNGVPYIF